jgi:hypothetical protein
MNSLFATVVGIALALGAPQGMQPRVLSGDSAHCDAILIRGGHIVVENVCTKRSVGLDHAEVTWDGHVATITVSDEKASGQWIRAHSVLQRLSMEYHDLYWDGKRVDLGKVGVFGIYEAFPWQGGVLVYGRTIPRRVFLSPGHSKVTSSKIETSNLTVQFSVPPRNLWVEEGQFSSLGGEKDSASHPNPVWVI